MFFKSSEAFDIMDCFGRGSINGAGKELTCPLQTLHFSANIWYPIFCLVYFVGDKVSLWHHALETDFSDTKICLIWPAGKERHIIPHNDDFRGHLFKGHDKTMT